MNIYLRLDRLRKAKGLPWRDLAEFLGISRTWLHHVKKGEHDLGVKAMYRLLQAEREAGIDTREEGVLSGIARASATVKQSGDPSAASYVLKEELRAVELSDELRIWKHRAQEAERRLEQIKAIVGSPDTQLCERKLKK